MAGPQIAIVSEGARPGSARSRKGSDRRPVIRNPTRIRVWTKRGRVGPLPRLGVLFGASRAHPALKKMFRALTVSREYGSGAGTIARLIAGRLRWSLLDEALVREIARSAHVDAKIVERCDERVDSWWHRFNRGGLQAAGIEAGIVPADVQFFDAERVASIAEQVIGNAAASGNC